MAKVGYSIRSTNRIIVVRAGFRAFCNKYMTMMKAMIKATKATAERMSNLVHSGKPGSRDFEHIYNLSPHKSG